MHGSNHCFIPIIQIFKLLMMVPLEFTDNLTHIPTSEIIIYIKELA